MSPSPYLIPFKKTNLDLSQGCLMGILNITPDSFSDGNHFLNSSQALSHVATMLKEGASIIDIGAESSRPGSEEISLEEEQNRLFPVLEKIRTEFDCLISIDTQKAEIAKQALEMGADMINDISGLADPHMRTLLAQTAVPVIAMHRLGKSKVMQLSPQYQDFKSEIFDFFDQVIKKAEASGMSADQLILDPGIGFGKTLEHNLELHQMAKPLLQKRHPLLYGISRKSYLGQILNQPNPLKRLKGCLAATAYLWTQGVRFFRVHDVAAHFELLQVLRKLA